MGWTDRHPCPSCGKEHEEREMLNKCTNCGQIYCNDYSCNKDGCPRCGSHGVTPVQWNSIEHKWG